MLGAAEQSRSGQVAVTETPARFIHVPASIRFNAVVEPGFELERVAIGQRIEALDHVGRGDVVPVDDEGAAIALPLRRRLAMRRVVVNAHCYDPSTSAAKRAALFPVAGGR